MVATYLPYPESLPTEAIGEIISIVRAGELLTARARFGSRAWEFTGWGLRVTLGTPEGTPVYSATLADVELLSELLGVMGGGAKQAVGAVDWKTLVRAILKAVAEMLDKLFEE